MITYIEYIKLLEKNNLKFYDCNKRISYWRLKNFLFNQTGGGNLKKRIKNLNELEPHNLEKVVLHSIDKNFNIIKYYLES